MSFGWSYPPGVTGNEPEITGEWPCRVCGGQGYDEDEDGKFSCQWCKGTGLEPEDATVDQVRWLADFYSPKDAREYVAKCACEWLDRHDPKTRAYIRECIEAVR